MSNDSLVTVRNFGNPQEAAIAQGILQDNGIPAFVQGGESATMLSYFGTAVGGVNLQVPQSMRERADGLLAKKLESGEPVPEWTCPNCGAQVDAGFEVCWQCSSPYAPSTGATGGTPVAGVESVSTPARASDDAEPAETPGDEILERIWRSAIFGLVIWPFDWYALYLLGDARNVELSERARSRLLKTHALVYGVLFVQLFFFLGGVYWMAEIVEVFRSMVNPMEMPDS